MNEDEKLSSKLLIMMFIGSIVLLCVVAGVIIFNSPKTIAPTVSFYEEETVVSEPAEISSVEVSTESVSPFPININTATLEELQLIPNIGPKTAQLIIDYREEQGTIVTFRELLSINGIGEKTVDVLKEYCKIS